MIQNTPNLHAADPLFPSGPPAPDALRKLADTCEAAGFEQQRPMVEAALAALEQHYLRLFPLPWAEAREQATFFASAGAAESAAISLMPGHAVFTGGRLADGSIVAQVILPGGGGGHSRRARWIAMGWLAALLRAVAARLDGVTAPQGPDHD